MKKVVQKSQEEQQDFLRPGPGPGKNQGVQKVVQKSQEELEDIPRLREVTVASDDLGDLDCLSLTASIV